MEGESHLRPCDARQISQASGQFFSLSRASEHVIWTIVSSSDFQMNFRHAPALLSNGSSRVRESNVCHVTFSKPEAAAYAAYGQYWRNGHNGTRSFRPPQIIWTFCILYQAYNEFSLSENFTSP
jgi:hypothetical protein